MAIIPLIPPSGVVGDGTTDDRGAIASYDSTLSTADAGILLEDGTYRIASNLTLNHVLVFEPGARLKPDSGVTVHLAAGYQAGDYDWVFDLSAGGKVTGTKTEMGYVTDINFGAKGDNSNDDAPAMQAAIRFATLQAVRYEYATGLDVKMPVTAAKRYYGSGVIVNRTLNIYGDVRADRSINGVTIRAANGIAAVFTIPYPGGLSAGTAGGDGWSETYSLDILSVLYGGDKTIAFGGTWAKLSNITILPTTAGGYDVGVLHNTIAFFDNVYVYQAGKIGFFAEAQTSGGFSYSYGAFRSDYVFGGAQMFGNVNLSHYVDCTAYGTVTGDGFVATGNNAGTITYDTCNASSNNGTGFLENTSIGCNYVNCHTAGNAWKVSNGGTYWLCIKPHTSASTNEPGVGVDWREFWIETPTATTADVAWSSGVVQRPSTALNVLSPNSTTSVINHYSEGGIELGATLRGRCVATGGTLCSLGRIVLHPELGQASVLNGIRSTARKVYGQAEDGSKTWNAALGNYGDYTVPKVMTWNHSDGGDWSFEWQSTRKSFAIRSTAGHEVMEFPTSTFNSGGYTGGDKVAFKYGVMLGNNNTGWGRIRAVANLAGITDAAMGPAVRGERWFYTQATPGGKEGAVCTTSGTIGSTAVIKEFGLIDT